MSILIYAESGEGKFKKVALELASYAKNVADTLGTTVTAITVNKEDVSELSNYGVSKVLKVSNDTLKDFNAKAYADVIKQAAQKEGAKIIQTPCSDAVTQKWTAGNGQLKSKLKPNFCMGVNTIELNQPLELQACSDSNNQKWTTQSDEE